jgi:predicted RNase H-like HicB family nuclease
MIFTVETEEEADGRWIAEVQELSGAMTYGRTRDEAIAHAEALALRIVAERLENGEELATPIQISFAAA